MSNPQENGCARHELADEPTVGRMYLEAGCWQKRPSRTWLSLGIPNIYILQAPKEVFFTYLDLEGMVSRSSHDMQFMPGSRDT